MITNPIFSSLYLSNQIAQTLNLTIWPNKAHTLTYKNSTPSGCNNIGIRKLVNVIIFIEQSVY